MCRILFLGLAFLFHACAVTPPSRRELRYDYPFERPVLSRTGTILPITDRDWWACDQTADEQARLESAYRRLGPGGLLRNEVVDFFTFGFASDPGAQRVLAQPESPDETRMRQRTYERLMRACLVNRGYAIVVTP